MMDIAHTAPDANARYMRFQTRNINNIANPNPIELKPISELKVFTSFDAGARLASLMRVSQGKFSHENGAGETLNF